jgi:hypothetical protein
MVTIGILLISGLWVRLLSPLLRVVNRFAPPIWAPSLTARCSAPPTRPRHCSGPAVNHDALAHARMEPSNYAREEPPVSQLDDVDERVRVEANDRPADRGEGSKAAGNSTESHRTRREVRPRGPNTIHPSTPITGTTRVDQVVRCAYPYGAEARALSAMARMAAFGANGSVGLPRYSANVGKEESNDRRRYPTRQRHRRRWPPRPGRGVASPIEPISSGPLVERLPVDREENATAGSRTDCRP